MKLVSLLRSKVFRMIVVILMVLPFYCLAAVEIVRFPEREKI